MEPASPLPPPPLVPIVSDSAQPTVTAAPQPAEPTAAPAASAPSPDVSTPPVAPEDAVVNRELQREYYSLRFPRRYSSHSHKDLKQLAEFKFEQAVTNAAATGSPTGSAAAARSRASSSSVSPDPSSLARHNSSSPSGSGSGSPVSAAAGASPARVMTFASAAPPNTAPGEGASTTAPNRSVFAATGPAGSRPPSEHSRHSGISSATNSVHEARIQRLIRQVFVPTTLPNADATGTSGSSPSAADQTTVVVVSSSLVVKSESPVQTVTGAESTPLPPHPLITSSVNADAAESSPGTSAITGKGRGPSAILAPTPQHPSAAADVHVPSPSRSTSSPSSTNQSDIHSPSPSLSTESNATPAADAPAAAAAATPNRDHTVSPPAKRKPRSGMSAWSTRVLTAAQLPHVCVTIPSTAIVSPTMLADKNAYRVYVVLMSTDYGHWSVRRRYSDFVALDRALRELKIYSTNALSNPTPAPTQPSQPSIARSIISLVSSPASVLAPVLIQPAQSLPPLPPKLLLQASGDDLERRRVGLETYLARALQSVHISRTHQLWDFLCRSAADAAPWLEHNLELIEPADAPASPQLGLAPSPALPPPPSSQSPHPSSENLAALTHEEPSLQTSSTETEASSTNATTAAKKPPHRFQWFFGSSSSPKSILESTAEAATGTTAITATPESHAVTTSTAPDSSSTPAAPAVAPTAPTASAQPFSKPLGQCTSLLADMARVRLAEQLDALVCQTDVNGCVSRELLLQHFGILVADGTNSGVNELGDRLCIVIRRLGTYAIGRSSNEQPNAVPAIPQHVRIVHVSQFLRTLHFGTPEEKLALGFRFIDLNCVGYFTLNQLVSVLSLLRRVATRALLLQLPTISSSAPIDTPTITTTNSTTHHGAVWTANANIDAPHTQPSQRSAEDDAFQRRCVALFHAMDTQRTGRVTLKEYSSFCATHGLELASLGLVATPQFLFETKVGINSDDGAALRESASSPPRADVARSEAISIASTSPPTAHSVIHPQPHLVASPDFGLMSQAFLAQPMQGRGLFCDGTLHFDFVMAILVGVRLCLAVTNDEWQKLTSQRQRQRKHRQQPPSERTSNVSSTSSDTFPPGDASYTSSQQSSQYSSQQSSFVGESGFPQQHQSSASSSVTQSSGVAGSFTSVGSNSDRPSPLPTMSPTGVAASLPVLPKRIVALPQIFGGGAIKEHNPHIFKALRVYLNIEDNEFGFWLSPELVIGSLLLGHSNIPSVKQSEGKSKSMFYTSRDGRYVIKTVSSAEHSQLKAMAPSYLDYISRPENSQTCLCRILGHFSIRGTAHQQGLLALSRQYGNGEQNIGSFPLAEESADYNLALNATAAAASSASSAASTASSSTGVTPGHATSGASTHFIVMGSAFFDVTKCCNIDHDLSEKFDLKGSTIGRSAGPHTPPGGVLKDMDFTRLGRSIYLAPNDATRLQGQVERDAAFLQSQGIIDYSMLLGIRLESVGTHNSEQSSSSSSSPSKRKSVRASLFRSNSSNLAKSSGTDARERHSMVAGAVSELAGIFSGSGFRSRQAGDRTSGSPRSSFKRRSDVAGGENDAQRAAQAALTMAAEQTALATARLRLEQQRAVVAFMGGLSPWPSNALIFAVSLLPSQDDGVSAHLGALYGLGYGLSVDSPGGRVLRSTALHEVGDDGLTEGQPLDTSDHLSSRHSTGGSRVQPVYYLAIVDTLTCYTWQKRAERFLRGGPFDMQSVSSAPAAIYAPRFSKYIASICHNPEKQQQHTDEARSFTLALDSPGSCVGRGTC
ncbi:hypothetical protein CAOG_008783 [Capsaspora owczarzaki ATCC 30864]|uniref:Phosphatidylinositol-4-phosphate 5-kinase n=2 Tax=Capsaspora owczarzaki (strain ATCC 30864) TaxID=595528 RepID=A0A0D2UF56_CAPO3|nr:hypothetical protein CAOG_008783 [Capsaspora owczarzaki ATCC 30864]